MTKLFKPLISWWRLWRKTKNISISYRLLPELFTPVVDSLEKYGKHYSHKQLSLFGKHGELLLKFLKSKSISFLSATDGTEIITIVCNGMNVRLHVHNYDNLRVVEELFIDQLYDFHTNDKYVVFDVGMNIAAASLYFASFDNVEKVYGYEPFPQTYSRAVENLSINETLSEKIEPFAYGLGHKEEILEVPLPSDGFLGGSTSEDFIDQLPESMKKGVIKVELKDGCNEIRKNMARHIGKKILLKLDCEGAEYEIMEELEKRSLLNEISILMVEFHFKGKKPLLDILKRNNFLVMSPVSDEVNFFGMLYAIKLPS